MKFSILTKLNPNAINARYGRPASDCDAPRQAAGHLIFADSAEEALKLISDELDDDASAYGYPERIFHSITEIRATA